MAKFKRGNLDLKTNQKIRLGDGSESKLTFDGSALTLDLNSTEIMSLTDTAQTLGVSGDMSIQLDQSANSIKMYYLGTGLSDERLKIEPNRTVIGAWDDAFITLIDSAQIISAAVNLETRLYIEEDQQYLGDSGSTRVLVDTDSDYIELVATGGSTARIEQFYQRLGRTDWSYVELTSSLTPSENKFEISINQVSELLLDQDGLQLKTGETVNDISGDTFLSSDSTSSLATEHAIKSYVDFKTGTIGGETYSGKVNIPQDSTSIAVAFNASQIDANYSLTTHITNGVDSPPSIYAHMTTNYDKDGFDEIFSGPIDSGNYWLHYIISRNELSSSSSSSSSSSTAIPVGARATDDDKIRLTDDDEIRIID